MVYDYHSAWRMKIGTDAAIPLRSVPDEINLGVSIRLYTYARIRIVYDLHRVV